MKGDRGLTKARESVLISVGGAYFHHVFPCRVLINLLNVVIRLSDVWILLLSNSVKMLWTDVPVVEGYQNS